VRKDGAAYPSGSSCGRWYATAPINRHADGTGESPELGLGGEVNLSDSQSAVTVVSSNCNVIGNNLALTVRTR